MPAREIDTVINFICRIILLLMEGIHLSILLCSYARGALIHVHGRLLQLVISTTRATYQPIAVHEIHFHINPEGNVGYHLGDLYNEEDVLRPWQTAPTPPPPTAPLPETPDFPTSPPRSYTPIITENDLLSPVSAQRTPSPTPSTGWDPLDRLRERLEQLHNRHNSDHPPTRELINNLALSTDSPEDASPKPTDTSSPPFTFDPNPSDMLDIPPPPSPNPFQPPGPNYGWGNE
ncbi:hypothetical protein JAAARDRAFT_193284 [Jaapia argillacea MUCL 33604]|uniref:Uncharacterized protein n=1 Tax=Jaapia argillacea MUCL 33604 TaxID=933084 RepID=A0A067PY06_9AGAM|nr:hypothetical protein JAAARDRAFT_193284 [Jaapia argillacea MUCL 33604]